MDSMKQRVNVARDIDKMQLEYKKASSKVSWVERAAQDMDLLLDEDEMYPYWSYFVLGYDFIHLRFFTLVHYSLVYLLLGHLELQFVFKGNHPNIIENLLQCQKRCHI